MNIDILKKEDTNLFEVYLTPNKNNDTNVIDISINDNVVKNIQSQFKNFRKMNYKMYCMNELCYIYDLNDDNQIVFSKIRKSHDILDNFNIISYKYSKLPTHLYPCTNNINYISEYTVYEYKITNRISLIIKEDEYGKYAYIEYKHSHNVDIEKVETTINSIMLNLQKCI